MFTNYGFLLVVATGEGWWLVVVRRNFHKFELPPQQQQHNTTIATNIITAITTPPTTSPQQQQQQDLPLQLSFSGKLHVESLCKVVANIKETTAFNKVLLLVLVLLVVVCVVQLAATTTTTIGRGSVEHERVCTRRLGRLRHPVQLSQHQEQMRRCHGTQEKR